MGYHRRGPQLWKTRGPDPRALKFPPASDRCHGVSDACVKLTRHRAVSVVPIHGWRAVLFGLPFVACGAGLVIYAVAGGRSIKAPPELLVLAGCAFAVMGGLLLVHGMCGAARERRVRAAQAWQPNEPWAWDYDWDSRGIDALGARAPARWIKFCGAAALLLAPFHLAAFDAEHNALVLPLWVAVCDLGLLIAAAYAARLAVQRRKFGSPRLSFGHFPFRAGEVLEVYLEGVRGLEHLDRLDCSLRFIEERYEATGHNGAYEVNSYQLYCDERSLETRMSGPVHLRFQLPRNGLATRLSDRPPRYWELALQGEAKGLDFAASFLLPIYEKA